MRWFLIFNPFAYLKLLLVAICVLTLGFLLAVNALRVEIDDALERGFARIDMSSGSYLSAAPSSCFIP
jgi:hypothetical protein